MNKLLGLIALSALVIAGCRLEASVGLTVVEDGSGTAVIEVGLDDELLAFAESFGAIDIDEFVAEFGIGDATGGVDERREGDMTFYSTTAAFSSVADLEAILDGSGAVDVADITLDVTEEGATFSGRLNPTEINATLGGIGLIDPSQLEDNVALSFDLLLPGEIESHDADLVRPDGSLRWSIAIDEPTEMNATSGFGGGGFPVWLIAVIAAGVVGIGGFLALGRNQSAGERQAIEATEAPEPPRSFDEA